MKLGNAHPFSERHSRHAAVRTPLILQMEALECGAVALAIILAYFGRWTSIEELRTACGVSRNGSRADHLLRIARSYGLTAQAFKTEPQALGKFKPPLVLHWNFTHFVVFEGFDRRGRARINDPGMGRRTVTAAELDESMTGVVMAFEVGPSFRRMGVPPSLGQALRGYLQLARGGVLFALLVSLLLLVPSLLIPAVFRLFVDNVLLWRLDSWKLPILTSFAAIIIILTTLTWLQRSFLLRYETQIAVQGAGTLFWHLLRLPLEFFHQRFPGDISSRVALNDRLAQLLAGDLAVGAFHILMLVGFAAVMVQYDVLLTVLSILLVCANLLVLYWVSRKRADANARLLREEGRLNGIALGGLEMIESLKASSSEGDLFAKWAGQQARVLNLRQDLERANQPIEILPPLMTALNAALILGLGGERVIDGQLTLGSLVSFQMLAVGFTGPVNRLINLGQRLQIAEGEVGLLDDVFRTEPVSRRTHSAGPQKPTGRLAGSVTLRGVTFGYSPVDPPVMQDVDLRMDPGSCVALVGRTSSGKSTLSRLILGLHKPWQGQILFDGSLQDEIPGDVWFSSVAAVDQDILVFEGTVRENLTLFRDAPDSRFVEAARDACILDEILARPDGFDSWVAEGGVNWSGGQLQRLEIARALMSRPSFLVLDEATSALDAETEARIMGNLRRRGCSCLIVAHRLSTIRDADEIVVLNEGRVVERGRHDDLIRREGFYAQLVINE